MHQIVYTSSAKQEFRASDLKKLLVGARMRNNALGVTGMLEGENRAVNEVFASIQNDPRHGDLAVMHRGPGPEQRLFGEWSMGFADFSGAAAILKGFVRVSDNLNLKDLDGARAVELLTACEDDELLKSA